MENSILNQSFIILKNGPIQVNGPITMTQSDGTTVELKSGFLCRCGASNRKPYCDGSHRTIDFKD